MNGPQLFPKPPRRMLQPTKDTLREQLALAAERIEALEAEIAALRRPWWVLLADWWRA